MLVTQLCPTLCHRTDCSPPGSSSGKNTGVGCHFLLQGIFPTKDQTQAPHTAGRFVTVSATTLSQMHHLQCCLALASHDGVSPWPGAPLHLSTFHFQGYFSFTLKGLILLLFPSEASRSLQCGPEVRETMLLLSLSVVVFNYDWLISHALLCSLTLDWKDSGQQLCLVSAGVLSYPSMGEYYVVGLIAKFFCIWLPLPVANMLVPVQDRALHQQVKKSQGACRACSWHGPLSCLVD